MDEMPNASTVQIPEWIERQDRESWQEPLPDHVFIGNSREPWCGAYIHWAVGEDEITLDGTLTSKQLRDIADMMDAGRLKR